ncbi:MAG: cytochrome c biogenesis protein CcsA [Armatimonadetes bacterium]|nr:cytochrome c biogenesis protein CcsA [Armatimonadota bacterium]
MNELNLTDLVQPPSWSLALGAAGRFFIIGAAALFALSVLAWMLSKRFPRLAKAGSMAFVAACAAVLGSFGALAVLFADNRFEFAYVYGHADTKNALGYRIAGIWSGQEGSFLLWAACSALFALLTVGKTGSYKRWYTTAFAFFLGCISAILAFESPFKLNEIAGRPFVPAEGLGLAPSLQNYWVIIHPPTIFLGFGSLTALFALAFAALCERDFEGWVPIVRPWAIVSATLVGVGLCMGGFWAYETLGWGGFWMWDPVENVSFVPWCMALALIHGIIVQVTKRKWQMTNLLLGGLPFIVFVYGTFLTRSGLLSDASVHSFAEMDRSALKLLVTVMGVSTVGFVGLWGFRAVQNRKAAVEEAPVKGAAREHYYMLGVTTLIVMGAATLIGMSVPLVMALKGEKPRVVEEAMYHQVLPWVFVPLMVLMAVTPFVSWRTGQGKDLLNKVYTVVCVTVGLAGLALFATVVSPFKQSINLSPSIQMFGREADPKVALAWMMVLFGTCVLVLVANLIRVVQTFRRSKMGVASFMSHFGVAVLMAGLIVSRGFEQKGRSVLMSDHPARILDYQVVYKGMTSDEHDRDNKLKLDVYGSKDKAKPLFTAEPGLYKVMMGDGQETAMVWPYIHRGVLMDTYVSLGQPQTNVSEDATLAVGEKTRFGGLTFTYEKMTREGEAGMDGTTFGAVIKVEGGGPTQTVTPKFEIGGGEPKFHPAQLDDNMELAMVGMNAADKSVTLRVQLKTPMYPLEIYHKPMTLLVWIGTGIMTIAGFFAAFYRRPVRVARAEVQEAPRRIPQAADLITTALGDTR